MPKTLVLIRCTEHTPRVSELHALIKENVPWVHIIAVPDMIQGYREDVAEAFHQDGIETLPLTASRLRHFELATAANRTGWICGDYVFLNTLDIDWDFAWIIEPDLYFLNGSEKVISRLQTQPHDLIGTFIWPAHPKWRWHSPLSELKPDSQIHAMSFPFLRISRNLALKVHHTRKEISLQLNDSSEMPNDESVVATVAHESEARILDLSKLMPDVFKYWSTVTRHNIDDIKQFETEERIVHSGRTANEFQSYIDSQIKLALQGSKPAKQRILRSLQSSSKQTLLDTISRMVDLSIDPE